MRLPGVIETSVNLAQPAPVAAVKAGAGSLPKRGEMTACCVAARAQQRGGPGLRRADGSVVTTDS